jgi:hypothetical protein
MNYLTNYYKNLSEQLQERVNYLHRLLEGGYVPPVDVEARRRQEFENEVMNTPDVNGFKPSEIDDPNAEPTEQERSVAERKFNERKEQLARQVQAEQEAKTPGAKEQLARDKFVQKQAKFAVDSARAVAGVMPVGPLRNAASTVAGEAFKEQLKREVAISKNPVRRETDE